MIQDFDEIEKNAIIDYITEVYPEVIIEALLAQITPESKQDLKEMIEEYGDKL